MDRPDALVTENLVSRLLQPDRLRATLAPLSAAHAEKAAEADVRADALRFEIAAAEDKLRRLYAMVEDGVTELDDVLRERSPC